MYTTPSPTLVCQHSRVAAGACLDCGGAVPIRCGFCGNELERGMTPDPPGFCSSCGAPTPWLLAELEL